MKRTNRIKNTERKKLTFYVGASTAIGLGKCFDKNARPDDTNENIDRSYDVENLLQIANIIIFSDNILIPKRKRYLEKIYLGIDKLKEYGVPNISCVELPKDLSKNATELAVSALDVSLDSLDSFKKIISAKNSVTTYEDIDDDVRLLMKNWHKLLCFNEPSDESMNIGKTYAKVVGKPELRKKLNKFAKEVHLSEEDSKKLYEYIKYYSNLYITSQKGYIYTPGASRAEIARCFADISNNKNYGMNKVTEAVLKNVGNKHRSSSSLPDLHRALLKRSQGTIEGLIEGALELRSEIEGIRGNLPVDLWTIDNKYEFEKWVNELSGQLIELLAKRGINHRFGMIMECSKCIFSFVKLDLPSTFNSVGNIKRIITKIKSQNYVSLLVGLAKDAGLDGNSDSRTFYKQLCEACGAI